MKLFNPKEGNLYILISLHSEAFVGMQETKTIKSRIAYIEQSAYYAQNFSKLQKQNSHF